MSEPDEEEDEEDDDFRQQPGLFALHPKPDKAGVIPKVTPLGFGPITTIVTNSTPVSEKTLHVPYPHPQMMAKVKMISMTRQRMGRLSICTSYAS